jgi:hypothetical protein
MAFRPVEYVKEHPWTVAAIVGGGVVLYLLYSSASGGGGVTVQSVPVDPNASAANLQGQQLSAALAGAQINANVELAKTDANKIVSLAGLVASEDINLAGIGASRDVSLAGLSVQKTIAELTSADTQAGYATQVLLGQQQASTYQHIADVSAATQNLIIKTSASQQIIQTLAASGHRGADILRANLPGILAA